MRFDDTLATVLAQTTHDGRSVGLQWRQLVDLIAQRRDAPDSPQLESAYALLHEGRAKLPVGARVETARMMVGQRLPPRLVAVFANDHAAVAAPVMRGVRLDADEWVALLPALGPTARALLRHREDLDPSVTRALEGFGAADLVIEGEVGVGPVAAEPTGSEIREMVARIEAFRQQRELKPAEVVPDPVDPDSFRWECGLDGVLTWSEGFEPAGLIGQGIAAAAPADGHGVEAAVAAAFAGRRGFRDLQLRTAAGEWRLSGVPLFEGSSGRFLGFRGTGRRPREDERSSEPAGMLGTALPAGALREMVHELRTPLNAIIGFAELIDGQFLGPAGQRQRARAGDIRDQAQRLVRALEDLDLAARLDDGRMEAGTGPVDMVALVVRLHDAFEAMAAERGVMLAVEIVPQLPPAMLDPDAAERLVSRLLHAAIGVAGAGETIGVRLHARGKEGRGRDGGGIVLSIDRPEPIRGPGAAAMLDPGYAPAIDMSGAPALGLGFALRLVRNLARSAGGELSIEADTFVLSLPTEEQHELPSGQRS